MKWLTATLLVLLGASSLPEPDPAMDQKTVSFDAKKIEDWPEEPISLTKAIDLITEQTGNRIKIIAPDRHPEVVSAKKKTDLSGKTFWEAMPDFAETWDMRLNMNGRGEMLLNYGIDMRNHAQEGRLVYDALQNGSTISPVQTQGPYAITIEGAEDVLTVRVFPEPRLLYFQCDQATLRVSNSKGQTKRLPFKKAGSGPGVKFEFEKKGMRDLKNLAFEARLIYVHDWKLEQLGSLDKLLKKRKKKHKVGLHAFRLVSSKYAIPESKYGIDRDGELGLVIGYQFLSKIRYTASDFALIHAHSKRAFNGEAFDWDSYWRQDPLVEFHHGTMESKIPPAELELWVRAPNKISKTKIKHVREF